MPTQPGRRPFHWIPVLILAGVLLAPPAVLSQECELAFEGFSSFGGPANFDNGTYRVEWCVNGAQITTSSFCSTGSALRMTSSAQDPIVWLYVGDMGCTSATIRFDFGAFATTGTGVKYATSSSAVMNCSAAINQYAGSIDIADGACHTAEHTVTLAAGDRAVYWKFDHGLPSTNAFFLDNVHVFLEGCDCDAAPVTHDCCDIGGPGCDNAAVESCVCAADAFCCDTEWDASCVAEVASLGCGSCGGGSGCATEFAVNFGTAFQSGTVCNLFPTMFTTCAGVGPYKTSGTACGGTGDYAMNFGTGFPYSSATTRCLDLSLADAASLNFSYTKTGGLGPSVEISINGGSSFTSLWTAPFGAASGCVAKCLDLGAYAGESNVRLRFASGSSSANGASFDDIQLVLGEGCPTCTEAVVNAGTDRTLCPAGSVALAGSATGGSGGTCPGAYAISWSGLGIVSGGNTLTPTVNAPGQYFLSVACENCSTVDTVLVGLNGAIPEVNAGATGSLPCGGGTVPLAGSATGCPGAVTVAWTASEGGVIDAGADTLAPTVSAAGIYTMHATCAGGCSATDAVRVIARVAGDWDGDGAVDLQDFAAFAACVAGPGAGVAENCACGDLEPDADIDLQDFAGMQSVYGTTTTFIGACCAPDGTCTEVTAGDCLAVGGTYHGDGDSCAAAACPSGQYRNEITEITDFFGNGAALADDLTLAGIGARELVYYDIAVYGGSAGGGPFDVTTTLYTGCPGQGGTAIAGTAVTTENVPDDGYVYTLTADLSGAPVTIPHTVWMVVSFSTEEAGWILAGPAEVGYTANLFATDDAPWECANGFVGETAPYGGYWANLQCVPAAVNRTLSEQPAQPTTTMTRGALGLRASSPIRR